MIGLLAMSLIGLGPVTPATAATNYLINSKAACQAFLDAKGANLGAASPGRCAVSSMGSEIELAADETLTVAPGWELFVSGLVFFNRGHIVNYGAFGATDDVVNNVESSTFTNHGTVTMLRGAALNVDEGAGFVNGADGKVRITHTSLFVAGTLLNRGRVALLAGSLSVTDVGTLTNRGTVTLACDSRVNGVVAGKPPVILPCGVPPSVVATVPSPGAEDVRVETSVTITFSERVTLATGWAQLRCALSGSHDLEQRRTAPATYRLKPKPNLAAGEQCVVQVIASRVVGTDASGASAPMADDYQFGFRTAEPTAVVRTAITVVRQGRRAGKVSRPVASALVGRLVAASAALTDDDPLTSACPPLADFVRIVSSAPRSALRAKLAARLLGLGCSLQVGLECPAGKNE